MGGLSLSEATGVFGILFGIAGVGLLLKFAGRWLCEKIGLKDTKK